MELMKGTLDMLVLRALAWEAMHGYGVSEWIRAQTGGALAVGDAALYQALRRLEGRGLVAAEWGLSENNRRARYYRLTASGRKRLKAETAAWCGYVDAVFQVLDPRQTLEDVERRHVDRVLRSTGDNRSEAARILGISREGLYKKLWRWGRR